MPLEPKSFDRCPECGAADPSPWRVDPYGIDALGDPNPRILWACLGARHPDPALVRFGILDRVPGTCGATRSVRWKETTFDLRRRAIQVESLRLGLEGLN